MRRYASGQDEPRDDRWATFRGKRAATSGRELMRGFALLAILAAGICASEVFARFAPLDREERAAAALADGSTSLTNSADPAPGIPDASERLREQIRTAESLRAVMAASHEGDPSAHDPAGQVGDPSAQPGGRAAQMGDPSREMADPAKKGAPSTGAPVPTNRRPAGSKDSLTPDSAESDLSGPSLAWLGLFGVAGASLTWWLSRRRGGRAVPSGSLSPAEVRAALEEIAASRKQDLGRPDLSVITRSSSAAMRAAHDAPAVRAMNAPATHATNESFVRSMREAEHAARAVLGGEGASTPVPTSGAAPESIHAGTTALVTPGRDEAESSHRGGKGFMGDLSRSVPSNDEPKKTHGKGFWRSETRKSAGSFPAAPSPMPPAPEPSITPPLAAGSSNAMPPLAHAATAPHAATTPAHESASSGDDRLERIERSLLAFTDVVKTLVENIPARGAAEREKSSAATSDATQPPAPSANGSSGQADSTPSTEPSPEKREEDLASAWDCFLQSEGVAPAKKPRRRSSAATRIARQGRAPRAAAARGNTQEPAAASQPTEKDASTGQSVPGDPLHDLGRIRESVLDLAGRGVPTEQICREVGLSSKEVGLILKSLFRANA